MTIKQARESLTAEESDKVIDLDSVNSEAIARAEQEIGNLLQDETEFTLDTLSDDATCQCSPDNTSKS